MPNPWVPRIVVAGFAVSALAGIYHYDGQRVSVMRHEHQDASAQCTGIFSKAATALGKRYRIQLKLTSHVDVQPIKDRRGGPDTLECKVVVTFDPNGVKEKNVWVAMGHSGEQFSLLSSRFIGEEKANEATAYVE